MLGRVVSQVCECFDSQVSSPSLVPLTPWKNHGTVSATPEGGIRHGEVPQLRSGLPYAVFP